MTEALPVLIGFALALVPSGFMGWFYVRAQASHEQDRLAWTVERGALLDRVQSPDLPAYYGARQAWHPEEFPPLPVLDFQRDDFGYIAEEAERPVDSPVLPGEMPAGS